MTVIIQKCYEGLLLPHVKSSQLICKAYQLTSFFTMGSVFCNSNFLNCYILSVNLWYHSVFAKITNYKRRVQNPIKHLKSHSKMTSPRWRGKRLPKKVSKNDKGEALGHSVYWNHPFRFLCGPIKNDVTMGGGRGKEYPKLVTKCDNERRWCPQKVMSLHKNITKYRKFLNYSNRHNVKKRPCSAKSFGCRWTLATPTPLPRDPWWNQNLVFWIISTTAETINLNVLFWKTFVYKAFVACFILFVHLNNFLHFRP